jgi:enoyl-CoA hydratase
MLRCETGRITVVTLDRPPANTLDGDFFAELVALLDRLRAPEVRAVVLTGAGRFFSAGLDLFAVFAGDEAAFDTFTARFDAGFAALFAFPKPVVAAVNGHAVAGGAVIAAAADVRIAADGPGRIGLTEVLLGVPFPASALEIVRQACAGPDLTEVLYHGRLYDPQAARACRLVDDVVHPDELLPRALAAAEELAGRAPAAFAGIKRALRAEASARIDAARRAGDPVWAVWKAPETRAAVEAYRTRTLGERGAR